MKRLTGIDSKGWYAPIGADFEKRQRGEAITRLGRYEDTGLTSKEILEAKALMEARNYALKSHLELLKKQLRRDERDRYFSELLTGLHDAKFLAGRCEATKEEIDWLERMVRDG